MRLMSLVVRLALCGCVLGLAACGDDDGGGGDAGTDSGTATDSDADTDADGDADCEDAWYDSASGLSWEIFPIGGYTDWDSAVEYCDTLTLCDHDDWRMPTISELRSLIRGCADTETSGECGVTDDCLGVSCWSAAVCQGCEGGGPDLGCFWPTEIDGDCSNYTFSYSVCPGNEATVWAVQFCTAYVHTVSKVMGLKRCVRGGP